MHWEILIIPLIAVGVWLLGTIFRGVEEERQKARPRRPGEGGPMRRPVTDLDRFLEEARRRREAAEERSNPQGPVWAQILEPSPAPAPEAVEPTPPRPRKPRPARSERQPSKALERVSRRLAEPATAIPVPRQQVPAPVSEPAGATWRAGPAEVRPEAPPEAVSPSAPPPVQLSPPTPSPSAGRSPSPVLAQVAALLRSPQSAGAALVLSEILGRPLCRRRP